MYGHFLIWDGLYSSFVEGYENLKLLLRGLPFVDFQNIIIDDAYSTYIRTIDF